MPQKMHVLPTGEAIDLFEVASVKYCPVGQMTKSGEERVAHCIAIEMKEKALREYRIHIVFPDRESALAEMAKIRNLDQVQENSDGRE